MPRVAEEARKLGREAEELLKGFFVGRRVVRGASHSTNHDGMAPSTIVPRQPWIGASLTAVHVARRQPCFIYRGVRSAPSTIRIVWCFANHSVVLRQSLRQKNSVVFLRQ